jgi:hypothetical protein
VIAFTSQNLTNDGHEIPAESIVADEAENQSFLGAKLEALIHLGKGVVFQPLRKRL